MGLEASRWNPSDLRRIAGKFTLPRTRAALGHSRRRGVLVWWPVAAIALVICAVLRGYADDVGFAVRGAEIERGLFGSPTKWLQENVYPLWPWFFEWASVMVHVSWFVVPWLAAGLVSWRRPERIGSFFRWWIALHAGVLIAFVLFPLEPPWMAAPGVMRVITLTIGERMTDANPLAAMPSLHVALPLTIAVWFYRERWIAPAAAMLAYSGLVAFEVVFSGEHYVIDVAGAVVAAGLIYLISALDVGRLVGRLRGLIPERAAAGRGVSLEPVRLRIE
jgi:PAP2 superfamily